MLNLAGAEAVVTAAKKKAEGMKLKVNVAVVDDGGHLLAFARMDGARPASGYTAITKAVTAATFRFEVYNLFDHANMYIHAETVDVSSFAALTGRRGAPGDPGDSNDNRRIQLGFRFEF